MTLLLWFFALSAIPSLSGHGTPCTCEFYGTRVVPVVCKVRNFQAKFVRYPTMAHARCSGSSKSGGCTCPVLLPILKLQPSGDAPLAEQYAP